MKALDLHRMNAGTYRQMHDRDAQIEYVKCSVSKGLGQMLLTIHVCQEPTVRARKDDLAEINWEMVPFPLPFQAIL